MKAYTKADSETNSNYTCPMHPEVKSIASGKCPKCGMDLVKSAPKKVQPIVMSHLVDAWDDFAFFPDH